MQSEGDGCVMKRLAIPVVVVMVVLALSQSAVLAKGKQHKSVPFDMALAIKCGDLTKIKAAVVKKPQLVNQMLKVGHSPLVCAVSYRKVEIAKFLLSKGAKVNAVIEIDDCDRYSISAMHIAVRSRNKDIVSLLLNSKANINITGKYSPAPLVDFLRSSYIYNPDPGFVEFLLTHGAKIESSDRLGGTPVIYAAATGDAVLVRMLHKYGADLKHRTNNGLNALHVIADPFPEQVKEATRIEIAKILLSGGADVNSATTSTYNDFYPNLHKVVTIPAGTTPRKLAKIGGFYELADFYEQNGGQ